MLYYVLFRVTAYLVRPITAFTAAGHIMCSILLGAKWMDNCVSQNLLLLGRVIASSKIVLKLWFPR